MNSITPITSLASTAEQVVDDVTGKTPADSPTAQDLAAFLKKYQKSEE